MDLEKSMQVSMVTLRVATTGHRHTDRPSRQRTGGRRGNKRTNGTESKLYVLAQPASKTRKPCNTPYEIPQSMVAPRGIDLFITCKFTSSANGLS